MSKKAEKRLAKRREEEELRVAKRPVEVERIKAMRLPSQTTDPRVTKTPGEYKVGGSRFPHNVVVELATADREGEWSWGHARDWHPHPGEEYVAKLINDWCRKTWGEIESATVKEEGEKRNVAYPLDSICDEAYKRLIELEKDDRDEIFRFRFSGVERLYGFRVGVSFEVLWYDPYHNIYPMKRGPSFTAPRAEPPEPSHTQ